jgi:hypothetical protein
MKIALIYNYESPLTTGAYIERVIKNSGIKYELFGVKNPLGIPQGFDLYFRIDHGDYNFDIPEDLHPAIFYVIDTHLKKPYKKICVIEYAICEAECRAPITIIRYATITTVIPFECTINSLHGCLIQNTAFCRIIILEY